MKGLQPSLQGVELVGVEFLPAQPGWQFDGQVQVARALLADGGRQIDRQYADDGVARSNHGGDVGQAEVLDNVVGCDPVASGPSDGTGVTGHEPGGQVIASSV